MHLLRMADSSLRPNRVRDTLLPLEYTLSRFVGNLVDKEESWTETTPACEWRFVRCNAEKQVTAFEWDNNEPCILLSDSDDCAYPESPTLEGELLWEYIPHTLISFTATLQNLVGPVQLPMLPNRLMVFKIGSNECSGPLDLTDLPSALELLHLDHNRFEGEIDLTRLPGCLKALDLSSNNLSGSLELTRLSVNVRLNLMQNYFATPHGVPKNVIFGDQKK
mmetsp:Transcript_20898/g.28813  ORF Transcript_20898/g.28813 Transcript_20898/m.28813 type:complete len:221 (-) Transcript_20898:52-714(-)|eukprot:CAMPEP_0201481438 /NCGR_PEP_ID=MMETSP0151_2-20130828/5730_1 /ASSEMBLY_ACC=CAM_ASM_000257 /TAXON_ID=200890 /ORGANISM="Paramoeba atlantica, Strain 621/1 / CCAP 1560/9" /LENGTH=220 /DNA_ID=CAMNT_0047863655 /DNA_START=65 /DNA_END=727 /DNA_ORIENTATION=-